MKLKTKNAIKAQKLKQYLLLVLLLAKFNSLAQVQQHPVNVNANLLPPYSAFLPDYHAPNSNLLQINAIFNDFNEPSWNVFFKIRIESANVLIENKYGFKPSAPITLMPGQTATIKGHQIAENFAYQNLTISGIDYNEFIQYGQLPEGFYSFKIEACDFNSGKVISETAIASAFINYCDPPNVLQPTDGSFIPTDVPQNIFFQWVLNNPPGGNLMNTEFRFDLYEITDSIIDPKAAIAANKIFPIYQADHITTTIFNYDISCPQLEVGKKYVYTVQAKDIRGRSSFKNNGVSEPHWFYYGYPMGGNISLIFPEDSTAFNNEDEPRLEWSAPDNKEFNQLVHYNLKICQIAEGQTPEEAVENNVPFIEYNSNPTLSNASYFYLIDQPLQPAVNYAWKVIALSDQQEVASSNINVLYGPPLLDEFYVRNHTVIVTKTYNTDIENLSGEGRIKVSQNGDYANIVFNNIKLRKEVNWHYLDSGIIKSKVTNIPDIPLTANWSPNGNAVWYPDSLRIEKYSGLKVKGKVIWELPFAVAPGSPDKIHTEYQWVDYNGLSATGDVFVDQEYNIDLLDPYNFRLNITANSKISLAKNKFYLRMYGSVSLPESIKGTALNSRVEVPFDDKSQLFYFSSDNLNISNKIDLVDDAKMHLMPQSAIFDFSDLESPLKHQTNPAWKGVYFEDFELELKQNIDLGNQLSLNQDASFTFSLASSNDYKCWATTSGLSLDVEDDFEDNTTCVFNTFAGTNSEFKLDIEDNNVVEGYYKGGIVIPVISPTESFEFKVPISNDGFEVGFFDEDLTNYQFDFNPDNPGQIIHVTIKNAAFMNNECLSMGIDMEWPNLGISMQSVTGFNAWGNYRIGFNSPNGSKTLTEQLTGEVNGYQVTVDEVGCGSSGGMYAIGTSAKIVMSDDIAGAEDAPVANIYSLMPSSFLDPNESYPSTNGADSTYFMDQINNLNDQIAQNNDALNQALGNINGDMTAFLNNLASLQSGMYDPSGGVIYTIEEILPEGSIQSPPSGGGGGSSLQEVLDKIDKIVQLAAPSQHQAIQNLKSCVNSMSGMQLTVTAGKLADIETLTLSFLQEKIAEVLDEVTQPVNDKTAELNGLVQARIDSLVVVSETFMGSQVDSVLSTMQNKLLGLTAGMQNVGDIESIIETLIESARDNIKAEINQSFEDAVFDDVTMPVTTFITENFANRITNSVEATYWSFSSSIIQNGGVSNINIDFEHVIDTCASNLFAKADFDKLFKKIGGLGKDAIDNFSFEDVYNGMLEDLQPNLQNVFDYAQGMLQDQIDQALDNLAQGLGVDGNLDMGNNLGKLVNGEVPSIYALDPIYIEVNTTIAEFSGMASFTDDDPVWGDSWQASLMAKVKVKPEFTVDATFINGKMPDFKYWFLEIGASGLSIPLAPIPLALNGVEGKVFHHMHRSGNQYLPDANTSYGAGLGMELTSTPDPSALELNVGVEVEFITGGFQMTLDGELKLAVGSDGEGVAVGTGEIMYNSVEKHFLGIFTAETNTDPVMCVQASMIVDIKSASDWMVAIGTPDNRVYIKPFCPISLTADGFLIIDNSGLDFGMHIGMGFEARANRWYGIGTKEIQPFAGLGFDFEALLSVNWKPFEIENASVSMDIFAEIGADWRKKNNHDKNGTWTLISIWLHGLLQFQTTPQTRVSGELSGRVKVLVVNVNFKLQAEHTFS